ncbi:MAG: EAL domain-containing protein [Hyphomonadaceae bacterium]|nr:EAL domain-containing protein [Hyphomonadaceae bacterium]
MSAATLFPEVTRRAGEGAIEPFFQPVVRLEDETVSGFEALARWRTSAGEIARIDLFPAHAWTSEAMRIGRWATRAALARFAAWRGARSETLGINITGRDLSDGGADFVLEAVAEAGVAPSAVTVELTEHHWLSDISRAAEDLARLRGAGMRIALDDFGAGHASLSWLARLPADIVKLDQSFIRFVDRDTTERRIVRAVLDLCAELSIAAVGEGVESESQRDALRAMGCTYGQGRLWAMPLPAEEAFALAS